MTSDDLTGTRIAENEATFRDANENIEAAAASLGHTGRVPFICECPDRACTTIVPLTADEYAEVRSQPRRFFTAPGHEAASVQSRAGVVVERRDGYALVDTRG